MYSKLFCAGLCSSLPVLASMFLLGLRENLRGVLVYLKSRCLWPGDWRSF